MFRIIIARHGESIWNQDSKFTGWTNIPLTNQGRKEASQMALSMIKQNIYPNVIFTSVLQRSIETSQLMQSNHFACRIIEIDFTSRPLKLIFG
jgi:2,3-bisphosphoglycerate-dependent phosphoglycerate mutase